MKNKNIVFYQIFVRNYSKEGTFKAVEKDLHRIKDLGIDVIYLLPIHEIGLLNRKGTYGSPYAINDYFSISKDLGDINDFVSLVNKTHELGMKIILDMVFNHTSPDNVLIDTHPEYYYYKNGKRGNRVGDWSDIVDLDTTREDTQEYLVSVLSYWRSKGVDGFRFDVSSMIPYSFFKKAREILGKEPIFFGECIDENFAKYIQSINSPYMNDIESMDFFDYLYNYNYVKHFLNYLKGEEKLEVTLNIIEKDDPRIVRVHCLENHDIDRFASYFDSKEKMKQWLSFIYKLKGSAFLYMGQEYGIKHKPELFEKDPVNWVIDNELCEFYKALIIEKHHQDN